MILFAILAVATVAVGVVCAVFWENIVAWIKNVANKIKEKLQKLVYGTKVIATKVAGVLKKICKNYVRNGTEWEEYVITKEVEEDEVPDYIRALENDNELDITRDLELNLEH